MKLGQTIRHYRRERGLTLKQLSELSTLSIAQISKLETGKSQPSVSALRKLSAALGAPMSVLTMTDEIEIPNPVRAGEGFAMRLGPDSEKQIRLRYLTVSRNVKMQPIIVTFPVGAGSRVGRAHPGEEFCYVLQGKVSFHYGETTFLLEEGDFIYYEACVPHQWSNVGEVEASILTCNDPPVM